MWDAPSWIGSAISAKISQRNTEANIASNEYLTQLKLANDLTIAEAEVEAKNYATDMAYASAVAQRTLDKELTELKIASNERIASQQIQSSEHIEQLRRELTASENALNRTFDAEQNRLSRENAVKVAEINAAANVGSTAIRTTPYIIPLFRDGNSNSSNTKTNSNLPTATTGKVAATEEGEKTAKEKADALFPELEPTFSSNLSQALNKGSDKPSRSLLTSMGAMLLPLVAGALTFVPFI